MTLESIVENYGYLAVWIGTFLEGETVLVMGGFLAHRGYLELPWVIAVAFAGTFFGDQLYFYLGRRHSQVLLARRPAWQARIGKAQALLERHQALLILIFRFLYGLRTMLPFVIGMSRVPWSLFVLLNALGALVWAIAIGFAGYLFGQALEIVLTDIEHYEHEVLAVIAVAGFLFWLFHRVRRKRQDRLAQAN
jgi:membrane protein DedA with SNARE-associated domain